MVGLFAVGQLVMVLGRFADNGALCDDAFYYFQIAKNAAAGNGFSFDGLHATNGFHPLFAWISVPVFAVCHSPWVPIRILISLLGLSTAATGYVLFRIGRSLGNERAGELMALLFLLSPFSWIIPLRGCEGGLVVLTVSLALWQAAAMRSFDPIATLKLGALVGLAGLARTENMFLAVGMGIWLLSRTRSPRSLLAFAGGAALVISPWVIWNLVQFGTVMQVSGAAKAAFRLYHPLPFGLRYTFSNLYEIARVPTQFMVGEEMAQRRWTDAIVIANAIIVGGSVAAGGRRRPPSALMPLAILVALHLAYYAFVQRSYFNWYVMPVVLGAAVLQGERLSHASTRIVALVLAASALSCLITLHGFFGRFPRVVHAPEQRVAAAVAAIESLPYGAHAGTWNAGAIGYFGTIHRPDVSVINLDCVVNNPLFAAWKRGEYMRWVQDNVGWLVERPSRPLDPSVAVPLRDRLWRIAK